MSTAARGVEGRGGSGKFKTAIGQDFSDPTRCVKLGRGNGVGVFVFVMMMGRKVALALRFSVVLVQPTECMGFVVQRFENRIWRGATMDEPELQLFDQT